MPHCFSDLPAAVDNAAADAAVAVVVAAVAVVVAAAAAAAAAGRVDCNASYPQMIWMSMMMRSSSALLLCDVPLVIWSVCLSRVC